MIIAGCGDARFDPVYFELGETADGYHHVDPDVSYSLPFDCQITKTANSTALGEELVPLGEVDLVRNPAKTLDPDLLTEVSARIVPREYETWIRLGKLEEVTLKSGAWPRSRIRRASRHELFRAISREEEHTPSYARTKPDDFARARVVEFHYEGDLRFRIPAGLAHDIELAREMANEDPRFYLPFVFSSPDLPGEGVGFVIEGAAYDSGQYRVQASSGDLCTWFRDRRSLS